MMKKLTDFLKKFYLDGVIRPLDIQFAKQVYSLCSPSLSSDERSIVSIVATIVSHEYCLNNICTPIKNFENSQIYCAYFAQFNISPISNNDLLDLLNRSNVCGNGNSVTPLVCKNQRVYIFRNWLMEENLATNLKVFSKNLNLTKAQLSKIRTCLSRLFKRDYKKIIKDIRRFRKEDNKTINLFEFICEQLDVRDEYINTIDYQKTIAILNTATTIRQLKELDSLIPERFCMNLQKVAAATALTKKLSFILGGPGTGKTTTVSKLLSAICETSNNKQLIIKLCAPTGKAATRLTESISKTINSLPIKDEIKKLIPIEASTIHRLLGAIYKKADFRFNAQNKLHLDVIVIDEASMTDLPLMSKLFDALPEHATVIFLGDKDQLASVDAGAVLGDICNYLIDGVSNQYKSVIDYVTGFVMPTNQSSNTFSDSLCQLTKSYRFHKNSGIGQLAKSVNAGSIEMIDKVINKNYPDVKFSELSVNNYKKLLINVSDCYKEYLEKIASNDDKLSIIQSFSESRILCATRKGECGLEIINKKIELHLEQQKLIIRSPSSAWYVGRPVMITKNEHSLNLYNGDIGICMRDDDGKLFVFFESSEGAVRKFLPSRLPEHETIYAMTIHKSQGSEFKNTFIILPEKLSPILTRELVYTGITRAKKSLHLCCIRKILHESSRLITKRNSGLVHSLNS